MRLLFLLAILTPLPCQGALVAYWNFNGLSIASASSPGSGGVPSSISADQGSGNLDLTSWGGTVDDFAGTTLNSLSGDPAGESLSLIAASGTTGNGTSIILQFSMLGASDPTLSFATQGTATGFNSVQLAWSTDGAAFTDFASPYNPSSSYALQSYDLSSVNALDGASSTWLRLTFDGASGSSGNNRIDKLQINAIPEPTSILLTAVGSLLLLARRRH